MTDDQSPGDHQFILLVADEQPDDPQNAEDAEVDVEASGAAMFFSVWPIDVTTDDPLPPIYEAVGIDGAVFDPANTPAAPWPLALLRSAILAVR